MHSTCGKVLMFIVNWTILRPILNYSRVDSVTLDLNECHVRHGSHPASSNVTQGTAHIQRHRSQKTCGGESLSFSREVGDMYLLINSVVYVWLTTRRQNILLSKELVICLVDASFGYSLRLNKDSTTFRALLRRDNMMMQWWCEYQGNFSSFAISVCIETDVTVFDVTGFCCVSYWKQISSLVQKWTAH